jgi:hypothetical protein
MTKVILSLYDYSGAWSAPYRDAGYHVIQVDLKLGIDIFNFEYTNIDAVHGILSAPPCTDFSVSGAQYWKRKDADGTTQRSLRLIDKTLEIVNYFEPKWWALENPVGRLPKLRPQLGKAKLIFQPHWYGDPWTKRTCLWGEFNIDLPRNEVEPVRYCKQGSWTQLLGGKSERTKELRSMTPPGFAKAFFQANP